MIIGQPNTKNGKRLQAVLLIASFVNLFLLSLIGVLMRSFPFFESFPLQYKNILHGHSHFAFGGWVMPVLFALTLRYFPEVTDKVKHLHWRNIAALMLFSAYGMLISFPLQGYKAVSITFSTLSLISGIYWAVILWRAQRGLIVTVSHQFLRWGLIYLVLSTVGPFATGPLIVAGKQGTALYYDAIYFFLHFQYNGFFSFIVLAIFYKMAEAQKVKGGQAAFLLFNIACIPAYALSVLWHQPSIWLNIVGGVAAAIQVVAFVFLLKQIKEMRWSPGLTTRFLIISLLAFTFKLILQLMSALPFIASLAYRVRDFVIGYLHLVLLGFISLFVFAVINQQLQSKTFTAAVKLFLIPFFTTEILLMITALAAVSRTAIPYASELLLVFSVLFPLSILIMVVAVRKSRWIYDEPLNQTERK